MKKIFKIGIIGNGDWGKKVFSILNKSSQIKIIFVETSKFNYLHLYNQVDWVYIATPPNTHFDLTKKFLKLRINVLCEKPLSFKSNEIDYLYKLAEKLKLKLFVNHIEEFKCKENNLVLKKNNTIDNLPNKFFKFEDKFDKYIYHDIYLLYKKINIKKLNINFSSENSKIILSCDKGTQKINTSLSLDSNRVHNLNNHSLVSKKDYIYSYFLSIFNGWENQSLNKKQIIFISKIRKILIKNQKDLKIIQLNDLNQKFSLSNKFFKKNQKDLFHSQNFIKNELIDKLEIKLKDMVNRRFCLTLNSCSDALYVALKSINIKKGDEVIVTSYSWISTATSILQCGARPIFCDVDDSGNINFDLARKLVSNKTKALIFVNLYGNLCNILKLNKLKKKYRSIIFIEDCAQSFGSSVKLDNKEIFSGSFGDISCTSFYPTNNLSTIGDGGAIFTDNKNLINKMRSFSNLGQISRFNVDDWGINSRLNPIVAIMLLNQIDHLNKIKKNLKQKYLNYVKLINKFKVDCKMIKIFKNSNPYFLNFCLFFEDNRDELCDYLRSRSIETGTNYAKILPELNVFKKYSFKNKLFSFGKSVKLSQTVIKLPFYYNISKKDQSRVIKEISKFQNFKITKFNK